MSNQKGFSLVEVIASAAILGIVSLSLVNVFVIGRVGGAKVEHRAKAMNLLRSRIEWVKGQNYATIEGWIGSPVSENNVDDLIGGDELLNDVRTVSVVKDADNNLEITVTITWDEKKWLTAEDSQQEQLVTLVSP